MLALNHTNDSFWFCVATTLIQKVPIGKPNGRGEEEESGDVSFDFFLVAVTGVFWATEERFVTVEDAGEEPGAGVTG